MVLFLTNGYFLTLCMADVNMNLNIYTTPCDLFMQHFARGSEYVQTLIWNTQQVVTEQLKQTW